MTAVAESGVQIGVSERRAPSQDTVGSFLRYAIVDRVIVGRPRDGGGRLWEAVETGPALDQHILEHLGSGEELLLRQTEEEFAPGTSYPSLSLGVLPWGFGKTSPIVLQSEDGTKNVLSGVAENGGQMIVKIKLQKQGERDRSTEYEPNLLQHRFRHEVKKARVDWAISTAARFIASVDRITGYDPTLLH